MGLPDETSSENGRSIEHAYKKYKSKRIINFIFRIFP